MDFSKEIMKVANDLKVANKSDDNIFTADKNGINFEMLKSILWQNGMQKYYASIDDLNKILEKFKSVSSLPDNVTDDGLKYLNKQLLSITKEINDCVRLLKDYY